MARASGEIARRMRRMREVGLLVSLAVVAVASVKAALATSVPGKPLHGPARQQVMHALAHDEPQRRVDARRAFPGDRWSQGDAFTGRESELVRHQTAIHGVALESVVDVLDADLRSRRIPDRQAGVAPCKPRPQYD
jgi:hypothetical protein